MQRGKNVPIIHTYAVVTNATGPLYAVVVININTTIK